MVLVVADTSALLSLATVVDHDPTPLDHLLHEHRVLIPEQVVSELRDTATFDDAAAAGAAAVLDRRDAFTIQAVELDAAFPLDDGENAAVTLANELAATQLLCDEFNRLALIHASLAETRLLTTPTYLVALVRTGALSAPDAEEILARLRDVRSWESNAYVRRAAATLRREGP